MTGKHRCRLPSVEYLRMPETHIGKVFLDQKDIVKLHIIHRQVQGMNMFHFIGLGERIMVIIQL